MKVPALRAKLKELGLPCSGNKSALLARLSEATEQREEISEPQDASVIHSNDTAHDSTSTVCTSDPASTSTDPGGDYGAFKVQVQRELAMLRSTVDNLCGTGNLVFGATNTLDMLAEIDSLRRQVREKNSSIQEIESRQAMEKNNLIEQIESLRQQMKEKDDIIHALSEGGVLRDHPGGVLSPPHPVDPPTPPPAWYQVKTARRRPGQAQNSWDPTFPVHENRFSPLQERDPSTLSSPSPSLQHGTTHKRAVASPTRPGHGISTNTPIPHAPMTPSAALSTPRNDQDTKTAQEPCSRDGKPTSNSQATPRLKVTNPYPEDPGWKGEVMIPVRPGGKPYNKAHIHNILLETDSIGSGLKRQDLMHECNRLGMSVDFSFRRQSGGQSHELYHHSKTFVADEKPHGLVIIGGTNDLPKRGGRRQLTDEEITNNLLAIGQNAKDLGVTNVFISSITIRRGAYYQNRIKVINRLLKEGCVANGFYFIDNSNILDHHTDGLHLTDEGSSILKNNIINMLL